MGDDGVFLLEEYKILREKAKDTIARMDDLERNVIIACSSIFVFALSSFKTNDPFSRDALFLLPLVVCFGGFFRYRGHGNYLLRLNTYCAKVERQLHDGKPGWLTEYYGDKAKGNAYFRRYRRFVWWVALAFNAVMGTALIVSAHYWPAVSGGGK